MEVIACGITMDCGTNDRFPNDGLKKEKRENLNQQIRPKEYASLKIACALTSNSIFTSQPKIVVPENITSSNFTAPTLV